MKLIIVTTKVQEGPDDFEETGDFGPFVNEAHAEEWIEELKPTMPSTLFHIRNVTPPDALLKAAKEVPHG